MVLAPIEQEWLGTRIVMKRPGVNQGFAKPLEVLKADNETASNGLFRDVMHTLTDALGQTADGGSDVVELEEDELDSVPSGPSCADVLERLAVERRPMTGRLEGRLISVRRENLY